MKQIHTIIYSPEIQKMLIVPRFQKETPFSAFNHELSIYKNNKYLLVYTTYNGEKNFCRGHKGVKSADIDKVAIFDKSELKMAIDYFLTATL